MHEDATVAAAFRTLRKKSFISISEAEALGREIAREACKNGMRPDLVVGIANGALLLAQVASQEIAVPANIINVRRKGSRIKQRLVRIKQMLHLPTGLVTRGPMALFWQIFEKAFYMWWPTDLEASSHELPFEVRGKHVLLVDDCVVTGASIQFVHRQLLAAGASEITIGTICLSDECPLSAGDPGYPDIYMHRLVHFYPWSANHPAYDDYMLWLCNHQLKQWE